MRKFIFVIVFAASVSSFGATKTALLAASSASTLGTWACRAFNVEVERTCTGGGYGQYNCPPGTFFEAKTDVPSLLTTDYFATKQTAMSTAINACLTGARTGDTCQLTRCSESQYGLSFNESLQQTK